MEHLTEGHQKMVKKGLEEILGKLCLPQQDVLEKLRSKDFQFKDWFQDAEEHSNTNLKTARLIWEHFLLKCNNEQQRIDVLNKLFHVQIATGPWEEALKTAQNVFEETEAFLKSSAGQSLGKINHVMVLRSLCTTGSTSLQALGFHGNDLFR